MAQPMISLRDVSKRYPGGGDAVRSLSLEVAEGEMCVLVGPSGCGKTTTMRMINRLIEPTSGSITVNGVDVLHQDPVQLRRGIGYVIQGVGLMPHHTVAQNVATVPQLLGWPADRIRARTLELMELFELSPELLQRYPSELSGGQRQRVGVSRALAADPPVMLMDEPFAAVDPIVRGRLQAQFLEIQRRLRKTIVFVTHDVDEALTLADRIAILSTGGVLEQHATPEEILGAPANDFVASFVGTERTLKRLALIRIADVEVDASVDRSDVDPFHPVVTDDRSLREALDAIVGAGAPWAVVLRRDGTYRGVLTPQRISAEVAT